jgi:Ras-related protein Rab-21
VFDITDTDSFNRVKKWVRELKKMAGKDIVLVVAGNKIDRYAHTS